VCVHLTQRISEGKYSKAETYAETGETLEGGAKTTTNRRGICRQTSTTSEQIRRPGGKNGVQKRDHSNLGKSGATGGKT